MGKKKGTRGRKKKTARKKKSAEVQDYRHEEETRTNNPPAKIAGEGHVPVVPKAQYTYNPHLPPVLRFDPEGQPDDLPELLQTAQQRALSEDEARQLAEALKHQQPWLEWAEKREQHARGGFQVDPVALHIHERISAQAILQAAKRHDVQRSLFADPQQEYHEAVQFYRHQMDWTNRLILGDSLEVMSSLAHREDLAGKVQMIYIDPPYGIRFASNFQPEIGRRDVKDKETDLTREPEMVKAYRDTWHLGIHSYLSYLRDRLIVAKELLSDTGSIFVQIGDENAHFVRGILDEVFGRNNFVLSIVLKKKGVATPTDPINDFILWYSKNRSSLKVHAITEERKPPEDDPKFNTLIAPNGAHYRLVQIGRERWNQLIDKGAVPARVNYPLVSQDPDPERSKDFEWQGQRFKCGAKRHWTYDPKIHMHRLANAERVFSAGGSAAGIVLWSDRPRTALPNIWELHGEQDPKYVVQTNRTAVARCMLMTTDPGDLVLDPTCGAGTTAFVAEQWGRRWITIDTSRVATAITRQRLLTAKFDRYRVKGEDEEGNGNGNHRPGIDPHPGFAYKTVPHITLKSIAQNTNLDPIFEKWEPVLDEKLAACNEALQDVTNDLRHELERKLTEKQRNHGARSITDADRRRWQLPKTGKKKADNGNGFQHWTVPFDTDEDWPESLKQAVTEYRQAWREKMDEVNQCIAENAEQEELVDQPETIRGVVRVSGPFTVEAVQPPELSLGEPTYQGPGLFAGEPGEMEDTFIESRPVEPRPDMDVQNVEAYLDQMAHYLKTDGVRFPNNRQMTFTRLERLEAAEPGLQAEGRWVRDGDDDPDPEGRATVAVAFGPQYGPVTAQMVEDCIRSAHRMGYDDLVIAGFSFDGAAQANIDEASNPRLRIHQAHIRPDVNPGMNGLLKEQPGSQLFTVFGQPRVELHGPDKQGEYRVTMEGVDIYDPVQNEVRSTGADKVAAWFLDADYDGRTFCITQAFFPDRSAWQKLSKALKGVIDEDAFEAFSGTESLPFPPGQYGKAAVKVIDPRGNEVMRVCEVGKKA